MKPAPLHSPRSMLRATCANGADRLLQLAPRLPVNALMDPAFAPLTTEIRCLADAIILAEESLTLLYRRLDAAEHRLLDAAQRSATS